MQKHRSQLLLNLPCSLRRAGLATAAAVTVTAFFAGPSSAGDIAYGEYLASECVTCHQVTGRASAIPSIVGWPEDQFIAVLDSYKHRHRDNEVMQAIAGRLGKGEMEALAAYFASVGAQHSAPQTTDCTDQKTKDAEQSCR